MELLEREGPLAALKDAHQAAGRGHGSTVLVAGEPGIGKTSVVSLFVAGLADGDRVLWGSCDDLSIPKPLGPWWDITGSVSSPLETALFTGVAQHEFW